MYRIVLFSNYIFKEVITKRHCIENKAKLLKLNAFFTNFNFTPNLKKYINFIRFPFIPYSEPGNIYKNHNVHLYTLGRTFSKNMCFLENIK